jgi:GNAT superfamily N-acetyltransferase
VRGTLVRVHVEDAPSKEDLNRLDAGIIELNVAAAGLTWKPLTVLLRDDAGRVIGGLTGHTEWGWLYVHLLYIEKEYRRNGYGRQLLSAAEEEAVGRGCRNVHLDTFGFQAPGFYEKLGYRLFGVLEDYPPGYCRYYFRKAL